MSSLDAAAQQARRCCLDDAVADDPNREKAAGLPEGPSEHARQEDRQTDDEPDVAGAEEEDARRGELVDRAVAREHLAELGLLVGLPEAAAHQERGEDKRAADQRDEQLERGLEVEHRQQQAAEEKADALEGILRPGKDRHPAVERRRGIFGDDQLDRALRTHLRHVLGDAAQGLRDHDPGDDQPALRCEGEHRQRRELRAEADEERGLEAEAGADVAAEEIGDDAKDFVEDEQRSHRERRVAEVVEVEQHQHAGGAVGNGIGPVGRGNQNVVAQAGPRGIVAGCGWLTHAVPPLGCRCPAGRRPLVAVDGKKGSISGSPS